MAITVSELLNGVASRLVYEGSACDRYPCWNDGRCVLNGTTNFFCECLPAFVGIKCEYKAVDICKSARCHGSQLCDAEGFHVNCSLVTQRVNESRRRREYTVAHKLAVRFIQTGKTCSAKLCATVYSRPRCDPFIAKLESFIQNVGLSVDSR